MAAIIREAQEQPSRALAAAEEAAQAAIEAGSQRELARAYNVIDWAHIALGRVDQAVHQSEVVEIYRALGEPHRAAAALGNFGAVEYWRGRWTEALECYRQSLEAYRQTGDVVNAAVQQANVAELLISRGDLAGAREVITEAVQTHRAVGYVDGALFDEIQLGRLLLAEGDTAAASVLEAAREEASALGLHDTAMQAAIHLAACHLRDGRPRRALEILDDAEDAAGSAASPLTAEAALVRVPALRAIGAIRAAQRRLDEGISLAQEMQLSYELGQLLLLAADPAAREDGRRHLIELGVAPTGAPTGASLT
jgi:tetratricopeptide (TPR) repeat protein